MTTKTEFTTRCLGLLNRPGIYDTSVNDYIDDVVKSFESFDWKYMSVEEVKQLGVGTNLSPEPVGVKTIERIWFQDSKFNLFETIQLSSLAQITFLTQLGANQYPQGWLWKDSNIYFDAIPSQELSYHIRYLKYTGWKGLNNTDVPGVLKDFEQVLFAKVMAYLYQIDQDVEGFQLWSGKTDELMREARLVDAKQRYNESGLIIPARKRLL